MTKSTITRERIAQIANPDAWVKCTHEEVQELARIALAAMDGEPAPESEKLALENLRSAMDGIGHIRRTLEETFGGLHGTHVEPDVLAECKAICDAIYAAYRHAQPAPVVPSFEEWLSAANRKPLGWVKDAMREAYDACRAAMLAAAPQEVKGE